jgi:hypothetical protein
MGEAPQTPHTQVVSRIFTSSGWVVGTFHVPAGDTLLGHLERSKFFTLTDVVLPQGGDALPFFALAREATVLVVPGEPDAVSPTAQGGVKHQVSCLLERGVVMGALHLPDEIRVSDHLIGAERFFVLGDCTVGIDAEGRGGSVEAATAAILNAQRVVGVAEM